MFTAAAAAAVAAAAAATANLVHIHNGFCLT